MTEVARGERVLVVDDEKLIRMSLRAVLEREGFDVDEAEDGAGTAKRLAENEYDLVLLDFRLPDTNGIEILRKLRQDHPETGAILLTAHSTIDSAVEAIKLGAFDYLNKPVNTDELVATIVKALETTRLRREVSRLVGEQKQTFGVSNIVGRSKPMQSVFVLIRKIAESAAATVLVQGDSGTGKDLVAKAIHYASDRAEKPFMNITCSALPETLLESELFGHERGAFTDARQQKKGLIELADGGSLFLDEIGEMGPALQAKMLRFLEEKTFKRVGGVHDIRVDVRVIAATNVDLERAVREGRFREDLYYRLKVIPIYLPSLRERRDDIPLLASYFVDQFNREFRKSTQRITPAAMERLRRYDWPGNVRELRNVIERAMILETKDELDVTDLPEEILQDADGETGAVAVANGPVNDEAFVLPDGGISLQELERSLVRQALDRTGGNQTKAARMLRISRDALRYKMKKFDLA
jgi:DNA-binding NtrC family response regulator